LKAGLGKTNSSGERIKSPYLLGEMLIAVGGRAKDRMEASSLSAEEENKRIWIATADQREANSACEAVLEPSA
jgi:hypothetical protein